MPAPSPPRALFSYLILVYVCRHLFAGQFIGPIASFSRFVGMLFASLLRNTSTSSIFLPIWLTAQVGVPHTLLYLALCSKLLRLLYCVLCYSANHRTGGSLAVQCVFS